MTTQPQPQAQYTQSQLTKMKTLLAMVGKDTGKNPADMVMAMASPGSNQQNTAANTADLGAIPTMDSLNLPEGLNLPVLSDENLGPDDDEDAPSDKVVASLQAAIPLLQKIATPKEGAALNQMVAGLSQAMTKMHKYQQQAEIQSKNPARPGAPAAPMGGAAVGALIMRFMKKIAKKIVFMIMRLIQRIMQRFKNMIKGMNPKGLDMTDQEMLFPMPLPRPPPIADLGPRNKPFPWYGVPPRWYNLQPEWWTKPPDEDGGGAPNPEAAQGGPEGEDADQDAGGEGDKEQDGENEDDIDGVGLLLQLESIEGPHIACVEEDRLASLQNATRKQIIQIVQLRSRLETIVASISSELENVLGDMDRTLHPGLQLQPQSKN